MEDAAKEALLAQLRAYLDGLDVEPAAAEEEDAFSLLAELTALKTEIKRESRQVKDALDQFRAVFSTLESGHEALARELEGRRAAEKALRRETLRPLLLQLLELRDRLEAGLALETSAARPLLKRLLHRPDPLLAEFRQGQAMT
ncbi:MAG: hypothetical protein M3Z21_10855, partial [Pseudomonadota bacterium]|nr:hypothetical protein [Pseudomonadota bacterium]